MQFQMEWQDIVFAVFASTYNLQGQMLHYQSPRDGNYRNEVSKEVLTDFTAGGEA